MAILKVDLNIHLSSVSSISITIRVLLVENEPDLGAAIKRTINQKAYVVDWVINGIEAWNYLEIANLGVEPQGMQYTLAIFDWLLRKLSRLELCQRLQKQRNPLPVLMLTAKDCMEDKVVGLDALGQMTI